MTVSLQEQTNTTFEVCDSFALWPNAVMPLQWSELWSQGEQLNKQAQANTPLERLHSRPAQNALKGVRSGVDKGMSNQFAARQYFLDKQLHAANHGNV